MVTMWGGGKLGAPPTLPHHHQLLGADRRCWACALDMFGAWRDGGCGGSFHPGAPMATGGVQGLGWRVGGGEASDGWVWRDGRADALLVG